MRVKVDELPAYRIAAVKAKSTSPEDIAAAWKKLITWLGRERALKKTSVGSGIGIIHGDPGSKSSKYEAGWPLDSDWAEDDDSKPSRGVRLGETPEGAYAIVRHKGLLAESLETAARILEDWLPESGYRRVEGPILTLHRNTLDKRRPEDQIVDVCIPVAPATDDVIVFSKRPKDSRKSSGSRVAKTSNSKGRRSPSGTPRK